MRLFIFMETRTDSVEHIKKALCDRKQKKQTGLIQIVKIMRDYGITSNELNDYMRRVAYIMSRESVNLDEAVKRVNTRSGDGEKPVINHDFDLLCFSDGKLVRLPFLVGKDRNPIGIFPFADDNVAIDLEEKGETVYADADKHLLPEHDWCKKVYPLKDKLNVCLKKLGKPTLKGCYFVKHYYMEDAVWIVSFDDCNLGMPSDYYGDNEKAKIRYVIKFIK